MSWFTKYCKAAEHTDRLVGKPNHFELLAAGLYGEVGSVLTELKKEGRETDAYPAYRNLLVEEIGDILWYLVRLQTLIAGPTLRSLHAPAESGPQRGDSLLTDALALGESAGNLLGALQRNDVGKTVERLAAIWDALIRTAEDAGINLKDAAQKNLEKIQSRWPNKRNFIPFFDNASPEEEQLPRNLDVEFRQLQRGGKKTIILRCNKLNVGDRITDNIEHPDFYRFHDIFHFSYAVHLGWSPVIRSLLNCKRKSDPQVDENQDGARARIIEEAVSAIVFSRAKEMNFYDSIDHVDYDLLKNIQQFVRGFEVDRVPLWQWETAILEGFCVFRLLRKNAGGSVSVDMLNRGLIYQEFN